jgi:hypothetical protein
MRRTWLSKRVGYVDLPIRSLTRLSMVFFAYDRVGPLRVINRYRRVRHLQITRTRRSHCISPRRLMVTLAPTVFRVRHQSLLRQFCRNRFRYELPRLSLASCSTRTRRPLVHCGHLGSSLFPESLARPQPTRPFHAADDSLSFQLDLYFGFRP